MDGGGIKPPVGSLDRRRDGAGWDPNLESRVSGIAESNGGGALGAPALSTVSVVLLPVLVRWFAQCLKNRRNPPFVARRVNRDVLGPAEFHMSRWP